MSASLFLNRRFSARALSLALLCALGTACAATAGLPAPRSLINSAGARISADPSRMEIVDKWVQKQSLDIQQDPTFWVSYQPTGGDVYLWDGLSIHGDTAEVRVSGVASDARVPYELYGHFYMMKHQDRLEEYLPEGVGLEGFELEMVVMSRIADAWLYGRSVFDMQPYSLLDELMYANEAGYLKAYLLTARAAEFPDERRAWLDEAPDEPEEYRAWFKKTFEEEPPGLR
jgi:hypothetical protein